MVYRKPFFNPHGTLSIQKNIKSNVPLVIYLLKEQYYSIFIYLENLEDLKSRILNRGDLDHNLRVKNLESELQTSIHSDTIINSKHNELVRLKKDVEEKVIYALAI